MIEESEGFSRKGLGLDVSPEEAVSLLKNQRFNLYRNSSYQYISHRAVVDVEGKPVEFYADLRSTGRDSAFCQGHNSVFVSGDSSEGRQVDDRINIGGFSGRLTGKGSRNCLSQEIEDSVEFTLSNLSEGTYNWACKFYDTSSQSSWSGNKTFNTEIAVELENDISPYTINHADYNATILLIYSSHLSDSLVLRNFSIYLSNGSIYYSKNMSSSLYLESNYTDPPLNIHSDKVRVKYNEIFGNNFTVGNSEWINITLGYRYNGNDYLTSVKHTIEVRE